MPAAAPPDSPAPSPAGARGPSSPQARAAGGALFALVRAARSVLLYDATNAAVREHLAEYRSRTLSALESFGELAITVRPLQLVVDGEVAYDDPDPDRSWPLRLYRDGVRRLRITPEATWEELTTLLEIVAIRFTAVRQQEEDTVTALLKAGFRGIFVQAVDGFTSAAGAGSTKDGPGAAGRRRPPPAGWDTPVPKLPAPAAVAHRPLAAADLAALGEEDGDAAAIGAALELARDLLREAARGGWAMPNHDLQAFFAEVRDALLADGQLASLRRLHDVLSDSGAVALRDDLLARLGDERTLELVLASVPEASGELPAELAHLAPLLGMRPMLDRLAATPEGTRRTLLLQLVTMRLPQGVDEVLPRLPHLDPTLVRALAPAIVKAVPSRAAVVVRSLLAQRDEALRIEALSALEAAPGALPVQPVCQLLADASEALRVRAATLLGSRGDATAADALAGAFERGATASLEEAEALATALACVAPQRAAAVLERYLEPRARFLRGVSAEQRAQQWGAVAGLGAVPGEDVEPKLRRVSESGDDELRRHVFRTLARRRRRGPDAAR